MQLKKRTMALQLQNQTMILSEYSVILYFYYSRD